nr:FKBP-type peptidyl-prolyl cis-trans isomerase [Rhodococcus sp. (in: high G+C Gram-positive bacteria)]
MNSTRLPWSGLVVAGAASLLLSLAACSSDAETSTSASTTASAASTASASSAAASTCPTAEPADGGTPEWTFAGSTGSVSVTGSTDSSAPSVDVEAPFSVTETKVQTLTPGDGAVVAEDASVSVCYMGVNGRDGSIFDNSYERGAPVEFPLTGVVPGFQKAIAGQTVGSTVAVAMDSADGYPNGQPRAGIEAGDSLVFAIKILDVTG